MLWSRKYWALELRIYYVISLNGNKNTKSITIIIRKKVGYQIMLAVDARLWIARLNERRSNSCFGKR